MSSSAKKREKDWDSCKHSVSDGKDLDLDEYDENNPGRNYGYVLGNADEVAIRYFYHYGWVNPLPKQKGWEKQKGSPEFNKWIKKVNDVSPSTLPNGAQFLKKMRETGRIAQHIYGNISSKEKKKDYYGEAWKTWSTGLRRYVG